MEFFDKHGAIIGTERSTVDISMYNVGKIGHRHFIKCLELEKSQEIRSSSAWMAMLRTRRTYRFIVRLHLKSTI